MVVDSGQSHAGHTRAETSAGDDAGCASSGSDNTTRRSSADALDARRLAQDWITLWESELSALAADPEMREGWQTMASLWAGAMSAMLRSMPREPAAERYGRTARGAGPADATRTPATAAAPDPRDAEIDRLARNVAALERRLAELERGGRAAGAAKRRPRRKF